MSAQNDNKRQLTPMSDQQLSSIQQRLLKHFERAARTADTYGSAYGKDGQAYIAVGVIAQGMMDVEREIRERLESRTPRRTTLPKQVK